ncbi:MAG: HEAT repeat domain-containing protein, partial [Candidatus Wukongarchaeota archaeon]|nr:HEAT repeat domain-containing protein [Candidatus Wukongarchaeota archaeon]
MVITDKPVKKEKEVSEEVERLIQGLRDEDIDIRWRAIWTLGKLRNSSTVKALIEALKGKDLG